MESALHHYIGSVCLWASAPNIERKKAAAYLMHHFEKLLLRTEGAGWPVVINAAFEAKQALYAGLLPIEATHVAFKRSWSSVRQRPLAFAAAA